MATTQRRKAGSGANRKTNKQETAEKNYLTYQEFFKRMNAEYGDMPVSAIHAAFSRVSPFTSMYTANPFVQNRRVKSIESLPRDYGKDKIAEMLQDPLANESPLRQVSNILEYTAYPMLKLRTTYQDLLTYHYYAFPQNLQADEAKTEAFKREWRMVDKFTKEMQPARNARRIVGQCVRDGKVFYTPRVRVDKSHNKANYAFMQQLPQDWVKIVGFNDVSKYTVAFNMFYFLQPGTTVSQFGDLFDPYMQDFMSVFGDSARVSRKGVIQASRNNVNTAQMFNLQQRSREGEIEGTPDIINQNGTWFYWVYLPADRVWTFEIDDVKSVVVSPFTGLMLSMAQIAQYEQVQLEIVQNPLVSLVLGQLETYDAINPTESDPIKVSPTGRQFFETLFYQMLQSNNTGGIGIYPAPFKDMKLVSLPESPNANSISSAGYEYAMEKSGMSALIPTNSEARAGVAQISLKLESRYPQHIYWQFSRMMNILLEKMNNKWEWRFEMFGDIASDEALKKEAKEGMTLGILPMAMRYAALNDMSLLDDLSISNAVEGLGLLSKRLPLVTSYSAKNMNPDLPPQSEENKGGRPESEDVTSEGKEADADDAKGADDIAGI